MATPLACMFDTNVFNRVLDGVVSLNALIGRVNGHATHVQRDEIGRTKDPARRQALEAVFASVTGTAVPTASFILDASRLNEASFGGSRVVPTSSAVWGVSKWDEAKWTANDNLYVPMKAELDTLNGGKKNNVEDALIAETAVKDGYILVTDDRDLSAVTKKYRGECLTVLELWQRIT
jgi:hypothetical protein